MKAHENSQRLWAQGVFVKTGDQCVSMYWSTGGQPPRYRNGSEGLALSTIRWRFKSQAISWPSLKPLWILHAHPNGPLIATWLSSGETEELPLSHGPYYVLAVEMAS